MNLVPQKPVMPSTSGWSSGTAPLPIRLCATGMPRWVTSSRSSSAASARMTPPPTYTTALSASTSFFTMRSATASSIEGLCSFLLLCARRSNSETSISFEKMSIGTDTSTAPGRPDSARVKAFTLAESGRPGAVLVSVPMDIFSKEIDVSLFERLAHNSKKLHKPSMDEAVAERIVKKLVDADSAVVYVGGGVILADAAEELRELVTHLGIPVAHSLMGKGAVPDDHPLVLGMTGFWGTRFINDKCRNADYVLALGTRFAEADCSSWDQRYTFSMPPTRLIQIDIDPAELGRNFPVEIGVVADLKAALGVLLKVARRLYPSARKNDALVKEIAAYRAEFIRGNEKHVRNAAYPMRPERILAAVRE